MGLIDVDSLNYFNVRLTQSQVSRKSSTTDIFNTQVEIKIRSEISVRSFLPATRLIFEPLIEYTM